MNSEWITWFATTGVAGVSFLSMGAALLIAIVSYYAMSLSLRFASHRINLIAQRTSNQADDIVANVLAGSNRGLLVVAALLIGIGTIDLPGNWGSRMNHLWFVAVAVQFALWMNRAISIGLRLYEKKRSHGNAKLVSASTTLMSWALRTVLWVVVLLAVLSNLGVNITAFVASLGVGGIAVALAVQNVLGDLFASLSIAADKPFEVGDFIVVNGIAGTVENVGLKTTRIRALSGEQVVMSNAELLKQTISNYKRLQERRILFSFGITYDATPDQVQAVPDAVKRVVQASDRLRFDRAHFKGFGESSLDFEVVYFVLNPDYNQYMDEQQRINLALMRELSALKLDFAFPTRTLHVVESRKQAIPSEAPPNREETKPPERRVGLHPIQR